MSFMTTKSREMSLSALRFVQIAYASKAKTPSYIITFKKHVKDVFDSTGDRKSHSVVSKLYSSSNNIESENHNAEY